MEKADILVVGAGVIGWSVADNILRMAPSLRVMVVDKAGASASGSTGRAAGGVRAQFGTPINIQFSLYSIAEFERMADEVGFRQNGYLFVTSTEKGAQAMESLVSLQQSLGVPARLITQSEVLELCPILHSSDVVRATFSPSDGFLDPHLVCSSFERRAKANGAKFVSRTAFEGYDGKIAITTSGEIECSAVVLATGHWSGALLERLGIDLPVEPERHQLALTAPLSNVTSRMPMVVDMDTTFHFRPEGERLLVGYTDHLPQPAKTIDEQPSFDERFLEELAEIALHRLPILKETGFDTKRSWAGWYAETPDRHAIIGKVGQFFLATGFGGHGIMHSPAAGRAVAELVVDGRCKTFDISPLRPSRFEEGHLTTELVVI